MDRAAIASSSTSMPTPPTSRADREAKVRALWKRRDVSPWATALSAAPARAANPTSAGPRLAAKPELDRFFYDELPRELQTSTSTSDRRPLSSLSAAQLARVVEWKLARGTWRPRLLDFAKAAKQEDVAAAAKAAAEALGGKANKGGEEDKRLAAAIDALCALKGVGPATATALLSAADPSIPFLSDEAGIAVLGERLYTTKAALAVTEALRGRAQELSDKEGKNWTASCVERSLWSASRAENEDDDGEEQEEEEEKKTEEEEDKKKKKPKLR